MAAAAEEAAERETFKGEAADQMDCGELDAPVDSEAIGLQATLLSVKVDKKTQIQKIVAHCLKHLQASHDKKGTQSAAVLLHMNAEDANRGISIVEIVKRRIREQSIEWVQYNRVYGVLETVLEGDSQQMFKPQVREKRKPMMMICIAIIGGIPMLENNGDWTVQRSKG